MTGKMKGITSFSRSADKLFSFVLPCCICTLKMSFDLDSISSFHYSDRTSKRMIDVGLCELYLTKQRGGDDNESRTVIFIRARHIHGHCG